MATKPVILSLLFFQIVKVIVSQTTCGGNGANATCVFPFTYGDVTWSQCTTYGEEALWCSTTSDYDTDGTWGFCDCGNPTPAPTFITDEPIHYAFTQANINNGILKALVIPLIYDGQEDISDFEWLNYTAPSISQYYIDSSWGKLNYSWTILDNYKSHNLDALTVSNGAAALEAFHLAEEAGYIWCNGICGKPGRLRKDTNHYDHLMVVVHGEAGNPAHDGWAGLGVIGHPKAWAKAGSFGPAVMEHEIGHNLGLSHQYNTKEGRIFNGMFDIGATTDGESRMGGGGSVYSTKESSRYKSNGHFGPCAKEWFGWLEEENIITLSMHGISSGIFTINAFDRPDVIPNDMDTISSTGSNTFLLKIESGSQYEYYAQRKLNIIYIYYRTSYAGPDSGVSVQFCLLSKGGESGAGIATFTYDAYGYTYTQRDHYVDVGKSFVIQPTMHSLEGAHVNPLRAQMDLVNLSVLSVGDGWKYCNKDTYICNVTNPNLSVTVQIDFFDDNDIVIANNSDKDPFDLIDKELYCTSNNKQQLQVNTNERNYHVIHVQNEDEIGIYSRGLARINFCATNANLQAFVFDEYPYNVLNNNINNDLGIGSLFNYPFNGNFDDYSCVYPDCKIEAVQVVQNEDSSLHIAEIEIFAQINGTNIANQSNCFSFPSSGNAETDLVDGDLGTYSHSSHAITGSFDVCVYDKGVNIQQVKVWPRDAWWDRSNNMTLNLWHKKLIGSTESGNEMSFSGLLFSFDIEKEDTGYWGDWDGKHETITIPSTLNNLDSEQCNISDFMSIPFISGEFYIVLEVFDDGTTDGIVNIEMNMEICNMTQCPINTYISGTREEDNSLICKRCPPNYYSTEIGITSIDNCIECPLHRELLTDDQSWCDIEECQAVIISHNNGLGNPLDGIYYLFGRNGNNAIYVSNTLNYVIWYNLDENKYQIIDVTDNNKVKAYSNPITVNQYVYPFLIETQQWNEEHVTHYDHIPYTKIQLIVVTQRNNDTSSTNNVLNIAEIKIFPKSDPTKNIAPTHANCFNFPINQDWYWYNGDKYGFVTHLNDNNLQTQTQNGGDPYWWCSEQPCLNMCYLNEAIEIDHIIVYPPQNNWRFWRTSDIKIDVYETVQFTVNNYTQTNVTNTMMDNAIIGNIIWSEDHIRMTENKTIVIPKVISPQNMPLQLSCPYKYAFSCDILLNDLCDEGRVARYIGWKTTENTDLKWLCMNKTYLTNDLLNYDMSYSQTSTVSEAQIKSPANWWGDYNDETAPILDKCWTKYIIKSIDWECHFEKQKNKKFSAGDGILCNLTMKNNNSETIVFNELVWSTYIIAIEQSYCYKPTKSVTTVNEEIGAVSTYMTIPNCEAIWDISLIIDQTPIGGDKFVYILEKDVKIKEDSKRSGDECHELNGDALLNFIDMDSFQGKFGDFTGVNMSVLNESNRCTFKTASFWDENPWVIPWLIILCLVIAASIILIVRHLIGLWMKKRKNNGIVKTTEIATTPMVDTEKNGKDGELGNVTPYDDVDLDI